MSRHVVERTEEGAVQPSARYRFGPLERRGLVAGWRGGQIAVVGSGLLVGIFIIRAEASMLGALLALVVIGSAVAAATWPVRGRTAEQWAPDAVRYAAGSGRSAFGSQARPFSALRVARVEAAPKPAISTTVTDARGRAAGRDAAVVVDLSARTYVASFKASASGFVLLGAREKEHRVASWSSVLASMAREGSLVHRVQWICRGLPSESRSDLCEGTNPSALRGEVGPERPGALGGAAPDDGYAVPREALESYEALLQAHAHSSPRFEVLLALSINARTAARAVRSAGGGHRGGCALVLREAAELRRRLLDSGIEVGAPLGDGELSRFVRGAFCDVTDDRSQARRAARVSGSLAWPWPMATRPEWSSVLVDGTVHSTYWISEWPRSDVGPDFLGPLLLLSGVRHTVSVVMEPVSSVEAARKLEQARTADIADSELRRRGGFLATARRRREEQVVEQRETELADGHGAVRFSGYVTVSASDSVSLEDSRARVEQAAARCGLELRLCYGSQTEAFTASLPLCRGLA